MCYSTVNYGFSFLTRLGTDGTLLAISFSAMAFSFTTKNDPAAARCAANGGFMLYMRSTLAAALCAMFVLSPALNADAAGKKSKDKGKPALSETEGKRAKAADFGKARYSGKQFRNKRVKLKFEPNREIVKGKITGMDRDGIYMDGEYFRITQGRIVTFTGGELTMNDLFVGLEASIILSYGTVEKTTIKGIRRLPNVTAEELSRQVEAWRKKNPEGLPIMDTSPPPPIDESESPPRDFPGGQ